LKRKGAGYHHGDLRRALVEATIRLVDARGADAFTLRAAAKLAGVSDGAPYHHFADKDSLLAAAAQAGFERLGEEMTLSADACEAPHTRSVAMGVAYVLFAARNPAWFRLMFGRLALERVRHPELARAADRASGMVKQAIAVAVGGSIGEPVAKRPPEPVWFGSWALVHGLSVLAIDGHLGAAGRDPRKLERLVFAAVNAFSEAGRPTTSRDSEIPQSTSRVRQASTRTSASKSSRPPASHVEAPPASGRQSPRAGRERVRNVSTRR
jgi:AcrR family transcriptional regulator